MEQVDEALHQAKTPKDLEPLIQKTGPGYQRFRLYERYFSLKKRQER